MWSQARELSWKPASTWVSVCAENRDVIGWRAQELWVKQRMPECSDSECMDSWKQGTTARDGHKYTPVMLLLSWVSSKLLKSILLVVDLFRHIWLQVMCDVLAACYKIPLNTTTITNLTDTSSQEWWVLSWPGREVLILIANCPREDAREMTCPQRAREVAAEAAGTSCLPPWCSSPTSFQGCCAKTTPAPMSGG